MQLAADSVHVKHLDCGREKSFSYHQSQSEAARSHRPDPRRVRTADMHRGAGQKSCMEKMVSRLESGG